VKRGLVESPELWRWSSYRAYAFGEVGPVKVNEWQVRISPGVRHLPRGPYSSQLRLQAEINQLLHPVIGRA
jgi:hypothetical protein